MKFTIYSVQKLRGNILLMLLTINLLEVNIAHGMTDRLNSCKGVDVNLVEKNMVNINLCLQHIGVKEVMSMEISQMACFGKCVMMKRGIIDENGLPQIEAIRKMISNDFPDIVHEELKQETESCLDESTDMIDPTDESCTTYIPLGMCMHNAFVEVCQ